MLKVGDEAPDFAAETTDGRHLHLADLRGRAVIIYFFPRAFTAGCTVETNRFRDNYDELQALGAEVIGISPDEHEKQCRFAASMRTTFPLIGDATQAISQSYDVLGRILPGNKRVTYVIDEAGRVAAVFHHEPQVTRHLD